MLSPALPYILSFCLLVAGVYLLDKAVLNFTSPFGDPLVRHLLISEIGVEPTAAMDRKEENRQKDGEESLHLVFSAIRPGVSIPTCL